MLCLYLGTKKQKNKQTKKKKKPQKSKTPRLRKTTFPPVLVANIRDGDGQGPQEKASPHLPTSFMLSLQLLAASNIALNKFLLQDV